MRGGEFPAEAAEALLLLIPKELKPSSMKGFRPLSLFNVVCKLILKVIVNRLKETWRMLISPYQASFVPSHYSIDNFILC